MRNIDASETSYTVRELDRNKEYSFKIRATNKGEWGPETTTTVKTKQYCKYTKVQRCVYKIACKYSNSN